MKKILISLSIIGVVATIAIGVTVALFNDTETSTGNIFVAGTMDLKVDHKYAMYNGNECTKNCVEDTNTNLILNGNFEVPEVTDPAKWQIFPNGYAGLMWTVEWESTQTTYVYNSVTYNRPDPALTEYHENVLGPAHSADQYVELDSDWFGPSSPVNGEPALTKIYQNAPTVIGTQYKLHYWYSPRPNVAAANNVLKVRVNGSEVANISANGGGTTSWTEYTYTFVATTNPTKIEFAGGGAADSLGTFLDDVSLHPFVCDYQIIGGTCTLWDLKDLGAGDYYWHYGPDMKPGDWGRNVISLHVYNNDAYACLIVHNKQDSENVRTEPEISAGDITNDPNGGELSQYIEVGLWLDANQDKQYNAGETVLYEGSLANEPTRMRVFDSTNVLKLVASNTYYIGLAWCFGDQTINPGTGVITCDGSGNNDKAQTDSLVAKITAYAEQWRNNGSFNCANVNLVP